MNRYLAALLSAGLLLGASACGTAHAHRVPSVAGERLDVAEDTLDAAGLRYHADGGGLFGIVVRSHWTVCRQIPRAGARATSVTLVVARWCGPGDRDDYDD